MENNSAMWKGVIPEYIDGAAWSGYNGKNPWEISDGDYRPAGWVPRIPSEIIGSFSRRDDMVLDQFVGGGTTLMEALTLHRKAIGCDINGTATYISRELIRLTLEAENIYIRKKDARKLYGIADESVDLICTQPPYLDGVKFSKTIKEDMSLMTLDDFFLSMDRAAKESFRVLKRGRYCVIMIGDIKSQNCIVPLGIGTANSFMKAGFELKEVIINRKGTALGDRDTHGIYLVPREYLMVFIK